MPDQQETSKLIPHHDGYRNLRSYQMAGIDEGILLKSLRDRKRFGGIKIGEIRLSYG